MSGIKISLLPNLTTPSLTGVTAIVQNGVTYKVTFDYLRNLLTPFIYNQTRTGYTSTIEEYQVIYNHSNLTVNQNTVFIIEQNAEYFVQGNLTNNDSIIVDGTLKIGSALINNGSITGSGIII